MEGSILPIFGILTLLVVGAVVFLLIFLSKLQKKQEVRYALNLTTLLVSVPLHREKNFNEAEGKKLIGVMEQFYSAISQVKEGWVKGMFRGPSALSFEMVLPMLGEEVHFYVVLPRKYVESAEKQITGFLPDANVERVDDYNIFNPVGAAAGSYLILSKSFFLPIKPQ